MEGRLDARIAVVAGVIASAAIYFAVAAFVLPQQYLATIEPARPAPLITAVSVSDLSIALGEQFTVRVSATNRGDPADLQIVSVAFPNATKLDDVATVKEHNFKQSPRFIKAGDEIGAGYEGPQRVVIASYPAIEAISRPWERGETFTIEVAVGPPAEGRFLVFVKAVALPHNGSQAHFPAEGLVDQQDEYVSVYEVDVTKA
jgi:hypothetical protein